MNTAAAIAFTLVMLIGATGITARIHRGRRTEPATPAATSRLIYDDVANDLGDPIVDDRHWRLPEYSWPTTAAD